MTRLAVFLDGTWNDPKDETNVCRLLNLVQAKGTDGVEQKTFYDKGVGTKASDRLLGGAFGLGLSTNVLDAYRWLVKHYVEDDPIYIFGFSRGAYTARSVAGLIAKCGLLRQNARLTYQQIYDRYQLGKNATPIYRLEHIQRHGTRPLTQDERELLDSSRRVPIRMIGVWDTVGALGIPWNEAPLFGRRKYYFHNTNPSVIYENCVQALAIDEHRGPYAPTLWTKFWPIPPDAPDPHPNSNHQRTQMEQRWFVGAHSNVGGGYDNDPLHVLPLAWMQEKATEYGLQFASRIHATGTEIDTPPTDSFAAFMKGAYRLIRFGKRYYRTIGAGRTPVKGGESEPLNEWIDGSVFDCWRRHASYRPKNLQDWAKRRKLSPENVHGPCKA